METQSPPAPTTGSEGAATAPRKIKFWVRIVAFVAVLFTAWHVLASFLWIAPYSENAREIVPGNALSSYMLPFFGQSWSVFAPEPINGDYHFNVRAVIVDENGDRIETGWVSATDVELSMIQYNLFPPRAGIQSSEVASNYKEAFDSVQTPERAVVQADFIDDDWETVLRTSLEGALANADTENGQTVTTQAQVDAILAQEHRSTAYATQVARAIWGDAVESVQLRVSRQNIIPFAERHNPDAVRPEPQIVLPGWRGTVVEPGQNDDNFTKVFKAQFERISD